MILQLMNNIIKEYEPLIKLIWAIFPFMITIIMAYIAYQQYKLIQYREYCNFKEKLDLDYEKIYLDFEKAIDEILSSKEEGKIKRIIELISSYEPMFKTYEKCIDETDIQLIKDSYKRAKEWFSKHDKIEWTITYFKNSFSVTTDFLSSALYAKGQFLSNPITKPITIYTLIGCFIEKLMCFFVPLFIQKKYKKYIRPFIFKIKAIWYLLKLLIYLLKTLFSKNKTDKNT